MSLNFNFVGRTTIVTGGNRGIGLAMSRALAKSGSHVAIIYRGSKDAPKIADDLATEFKVKCKAYQCDVSDVKAVDKVLPEIEKDLGKVHGAILNAGVSRVAPAMELTKDDFDYIYGTNVFGVFNMAKGIAQRMIENQIKGALVIVSSMSYQLYNQKGLGVPLTQAFYNSSKAAVSSLVGALAAEWAPHNIRVNCINPGFTATDQTQHMDKSIRDYQAQSVPMGRFSQPEEQTGAALLLLSDESSYTTGANYLVDGGFSVY